MWRHKHLLGIRQLSAEDITAVLDTAESCKQIFERDVKKFPTLRGKTVVNLFYEASTRTRTSFEIAGKWMSADVVNISVSTSSAAKGENLLDTARTIESLGADVLVIRHQSAGAPEMLSRILRASVVNAGDGAHEHPTQGLLDLLTIRQHKGRISGLKVTIVGDISHSRVARSNIWGLTRMGAEVTVCGPPTLMPAEVDTLGVRVEYDLPAALRDADVVNVLRLQRERQQKGLLPSLEEYSREYGVNSRLLSLAKPDLILMHPGPANVGVEISQEVCDDPRSVIREQVTNGVAVRMAVLYLLCGGNQDAFAG